MIVSTSRSIPIGRAPRDRTRAPRPPATATDALLLVGHGSHCMISAAQMHEIGDAVAAAMPDRMVEVGFLEMTDPPAGLVLDELVARGARRIVVLPLMLLAAGHGKSDVPAIVLEGRQRHPDVELAFGSPLGVVPELLGIGAENLAEVGGTGMPLLVIARGTSDPDANGEATKAARLLAEWVDAGLFHVGFTGVTWPLVPEALDAIAAMAAARSDSAAMVAAQQDSAAMVAAQAGTDRSKKLAVFFWFLCNGKLIEAARAQLAAFAERTGIEVVDAGYFGPDPVLVGAIERRYREALDGIPTLNCDTCAYRAAFPGQEDKVGQPRGVGHSHLAAEHRHGHTRSSDHPHQH